MQKTTQIALMGLSFKTAPLAVREQLSIGVCRLGEQRQAGEYKDDLLAELPWPLYGAGSRSVWLKEWAVLSTCNRIELYVVLDSEGAELRELENLRYGLNDGADEREWLLALLAGMTGVEPAVFDDYAYFYEGEQAAGHLLRVAAGLESQVLGEPQILGQVIYAYTAGTKKKSIGPVLAEVFRAAISSGKRARTDTAISQNSVSLSRLAIIQAQAEVGDLSNKKCLVVGLGEMGRLTLKQLQVLGVQEIGLVNRTYESALQMGRQFGQPVYHWQELTAALIASDVVICATGAKDAVISAEQVREVMERRPERPLYMLDIAVPRDVAPAAGELPGVTLWDADELQESLDEALAAREMEVPRVEAIIDEEMMRLMAGLRMLAVKPVVVRLRQKAEDIRQQELERTLSRLGEIDPQTLEQIQFFSQSLVRKLLHEPTVRLKSKASEENAAGYVEALNDLFDLK